MVEPLIAFIADLLLVLAGFVYLCGTYIVWPSRWNIPAHLAVGFWFVAYVVPILIIRVQDSFDPVAYDLFRRVSIFGAFFYLLGLLFARIIMLARNNDNDQDFLPSLRWHNFDGDDDIYLRRLRLVAILAIIMMIVAIAAMGFVPILAQDPIAAKFLRGAYGDAYRPVAPLYRTAIVIFSVFMVVFAVVAIRRRSALWIVIFGASVVFMVMTLQRESGVSWNPVSARYMVCRERPNALLCLPCNRRLCCWNAFVRTVVRAWDPKDGVCPSSRCGLLGVGGQVRARR